ncbi:putative tubulin polyglutamylase TTLL1 isoform X1 [Ixodes scapularis]
MTCRMTTGPLKFCCDVEQPVLMSVLAKRNWLRVEPDQDWNIYWASVAGVRAVFSADYGSRLSDHQRINHFATHYELTRKDLMAKHMKRYRRELNKNSADGESSGPIPDLVPPTFVLPRDYNMFVDEFRKTAPSMWIVKPCGKAQGVGISLVNKPSQVKGLLNSWDSQGTKEPHVVCRYLERPLLIGGRKFDLRLYALVTSFRPLRAYLYRRGFCRLCQLHYSLQDLTDPLVHLTNVSVQRQGGRYNSQHGGKWDLRSLELWVCGTRGSQAANKLWQDLRQVVAHSLRAVAGTMLSDWHCFECYGYDILLDEQLRPWLLEVNASPSLTCSTPGDWVLKETMLDDLFEIVAPRGELRSARNAVPEPDRQGDFELLLPEDAAATSKS